MRFTRFTKRATGVAVIALAATLAVAGCSSSGAPAKESSGSTGSGGGGGGGTMTDVTLRYSFVHTGIEAIWTYGIAKGYFKDAGINLVLEEGKGSATTAQTVANDSDDFGEVDGGTWLTVATKGLPAEAVMAVYQKSPLAILVPADSSITDIKGLAGKKIAVTAGDAPSTLLPALLQANGLTKSQITEVNMQPGPKLTVLATGGAVDAVATLNLVAAIIEAKGTKVRTLLYSDFGVDIPGYYLVASKSFLKNKPDVAKKFVAAAQKSIDATIADPQAAIDSYIKKYPDGNAALSLAELKDVVPLMKADTSHPTGYISIEQATNTLKFLEQVGSITSPGKASDYVTNEYLSK